MKDRRVIDFFGPAKLVESLLMARLAYLGGLLKDGPEEKEPETGTYRAAIHFFEFDDQDASSVEKMIRSVAHQLAVAVPEQRIIFQAMDQEALEKIQSLSTLFKCLIAEPCS